MTRPCKDYQELAALLPDGELPPEDEADLLGHAASCSECRQYLEDYEAISLALRDSLSEPPETLLPSVLGQIKKKTGHRRLRFLPGIAAAACLLAVITLVFRYSQVNPLSEKNVNLNGLSSYQTDAAPPLYEKSSEEYGIHGAPAQEAPRVAAGSEAADMTAEDSVSGSAGSKDVIDSANPAGSEKTFELAPPPDVSLTWTQAPYADPQEPENRESASLPPAFSEVVLLLPDASEYRVLFVSRQPLPDTLLSAAGQTDSGYCLYPESAEAFELIVKDLTGERREGTGEKYIVVFVA